MATVRMYRNPLAFLLNRKKQNVKLNCLVYISRSESIVDTSLILRLSCLLVSRGFAGVRSTATAPKSAQAADKGRRGEASK